MKKIFLLLLIVNTSVFSQELITNNSSFSKGLRSWQFGVASYDAETPDADFDVVSQGYNDDGSACKIKLKLNTQSGNYNDAYLMYRNLAIRKGKVYRVCFNIKSNIREDKVLVSIGSGTPPDLQVLKEREIKFIGDNKWKKISFTFRAEKNKSNVNFKDLSLVFGFNHRLGTFFMDNISVKPL